MDDEKVKDIYNSLDKMLYGENKIQEFPMELELSDDILHDVEIPPILVAKSTMENNNLLDEEVKSSKTHPFILKISSASVIGMLCGIPTGFASSLSVGLTVGGCAGLIFPLVIVVKEIWNNKNK